MTIWIDQPIWPRHGTVFAHLISDTSLDELHAFAHRVGLHPRSFEGDHYDVPQERYVAVLAAGATSTTGADVVRRLIASRAAPAQAAGDRPVARVRGVRFPDGTIVDVDLVASEREVDVGSSWRRWSLSSRTATAGLRWCTRRAATPGDRPGRRPRAGERRRRRRARGP